MSSASFIMLLCEKVKLKYDQSLILYLPPNHQLLDLEPIEKDDLLVLGTKEDILNFQREYCDIASILSSSYTKLMDIEEQMISKQLVHGNQGEGVLGKIQQEDQKQENFREEQQDKQQQLGTNETLEIQFEQIPQTQQISQKDKGEWEQFQQTMPQNQYHEHGKQINYQDGNESQNLFNKEQFQDQQMEEDDEEEEEELIIKF
eukprot:403345887